MENRIAASKVIGRLVGELNYTRAHIAKVMKKNGNRLKLVRAGRRWRMPIESAELLRELVVKESGPRYRLGEKGSRT